MKGVRFLFLVVAALSAFAVFIISTTINPYSASLNLRIMMYSAIFGLMFGIFNLIMINSHTNLPSDVKPRSAVISTIRQGFILAASVDVILILKSLNTLGWLDFVLIVFAAFLFELFFRVRMPVS